MLTLVSAKSVDELSVVHALTYMEFTAYNAINYAKFYLIHLGHVSRKSGWPLNEQPATTSMAKRRLGSRKDVKAWDDDSTRNESSTVVISIKRNVKYRPL